MTKALPVHGVDISHHQDGKLDLKKSGIRWLYHKATEGNTFVDDNYNQRRWEAGLAEIPFGAYHFARPQPGDATSEARRFIQVAKPRPGDLRPALDLETDETLSQAELRIWASNFCQEVARLVGAEPIIYTPYDLGSAQRGRLIWRPRYNNDNTPPVLPWDIWQYSNGIFGVPNQVAGLGHVDLNVMRPGLRLEEMLIPTKENDVTVLKFGHCSMQFSDSPQQMRSDVRKIFRRNYDIITGTEAGAGNALGPILRAEALEQGYRIFIVKDVWIAVDKTLVDGGWESGFIPVALPSEGFGKHTAKGIGFVSFDCEKVGSRISVGAGHMLTQGRKPGDPSYSLNREFAEALNKWVREYGRGMDLAFYSGDQNIPDRTEDTFFGGPLTSAWDELGHWENTGHGSIDVIASYDRDKRVKAKSARALDDKELHLNTDHFLIEAKFEIK